MSERVSEHVEPRSSDKVEPTPQPEASSELSEAYSLMIGQAHTLTDREDGLESGTREYAKAVFHFAMTLIPNWDQYRIKQSEIKEGDDTAIRLNAASHAFLKSKGIKPPHRGSSNPILGIYQHGLILAQVAKHQLNRGEARQMAILAEVGEKEWNAAIKLQETGQTLKDKKVAARREQSARNTRVWRGAKLPAAAIDVGDVRVLDKPWAWLDDKESGYERFRASQPTIWPRGKTPAPTGRKPMSTTDPVSEGSVAENIHEKPMDAGDDPDQSPAVMFDTSNWTTGEGEEDGVVDEAHPTKPVTVEGEVIDEGHHAEPDAVEPVKAEPVAVEGGVIAGDHSSVDGENEEVIQDDDGKGSVGWFTFAAPTMLRFPKSAMQKLGMDHDDEDEVELRVRLRKMPNGELMLLQCRNA
jgi:hypothetical protein